MGADAGCLAELQSWLLDLLREASGASAVLLLLQVLLSSPARISAEFRACSHLTPPLAWG